MAEPGGRRPSEYTVEPDLYRAGMFRDDAANQTFAGMSGGMAAGIYMGRVVGETAGGWPDVVTMDPANVETQKFLSSVLGSVLKPGHGQFLAVDNTLATREASRRLHDALACFGIGYYEEGLPYGPTAGTWLYAASKTGVMPAVGTIGQHLVCDPELKLFAPPGSDLRIRMEVNDTISVTRAIALTTALRARGFGIDLLGSPGSVPAPELLAAMRPAAVN